MSLEEEVKYLRAKVLYLKNQSSKKGNVNKIRTISIDS